MFKIFRNATSLLVKQLNQPVFLPSEAVYAEVHAHLRDIVENL